MPTCVKCNESFPNRMIVDGQRINLYTRKYCLTCSPRGHHNTKKLEAKTTENVECTCKKCNRVFVYDRSKGHQYATCNTCIVLSRWTKLKEQCVEYLGGSCVSCGYNRCIKALDFHHRESEDKEFGIGGSYNRSWEKIKAELDKCILTCANCHREHHDGLINLGDYVSG